MRFGSSLAILAFVGTALACRLTELSTPRPTSTALPVPEPRACPISAGQPALPGPQAREILDFLNRGGSHLTLGDFLQAEHSLSAPIVELDLNGDLFYDLAIATVGEQTGTVQVYLCAQDAYQLAYLTAPSMPPGRVTIHSSQDLTGDGVADLLFWREQCGAHTCTAQVEVLIWDAERLENRFIGDTADLPSPQLELGQTEAPPAEIRITATGIGSVGAGPYRMHTRSWTWDDQPYAFTVAGEELLDSRYRIHRLHDADDAASAGNFDAALAYYQQVIEDPLLDDWIAGEAGHAALAGYARFRRMITILEIGDLESAEQALAALLQAHPEGDPGHGFAAMGEEFWAALPTGLVQAGTLNAEALALGCQAAQAYAITHPESTLDPLYYGYANRTYGAESICPSAG